VAGLNTKALARTAGAVFLLLASTGVAHAQEVGVEANARYTAQRRPRVAVLEFGDTNAEASSARYGPSVEAMLATFFKRNSQLAAVERQKLGGLYQEKQRVQKGLVNIPLDDKAARELLEEIDAFIIGDVTLLAGSRIEIDAKLFSGFDGRIVAAAQRSGPVACLRSVVERLGAALEQDFLLPYHGGLKVHLKDPENVRIFLAPTPPAGSSDEERPQSERSSTVTIGSEYDIVEPWMTNPTTYTIEGLLSGWYSMRLERPGYEDLKIEVHVDPLKTGLIDGEALNLVFRKKGGSLAFQVKRQYLDADFSKAPQRVILVGSGLDLNARTKELDEDRQCGLQKEQPRSLPDHGRTYVLSGQSFDFEGFKGGELIIEDYKGETVPVGQYKLALWEPYYQVKKSDATVSDRDLGKVTRSLLTRETLPLKLDVTGARPGSRVTLKGRDTRYPLELPLDFTETKEQRAPADTYRVSTNISGLEGWKQALVLLPESTAPPRYYTRSPAYGLEITRAPEADKKPARLTIKTRLALAGRLGVLSRPPDPSSADLFIDGEVGKILDLLLYGNEQRPDLYQLLTRHLEVIDLLLLNPRDMARLQQSPEAAALVQDYVKKGGALFAFASEPGDYTAITGAPLVIETPSKVPTKRPLSKLSKLSPVSWRMIAFTEGRGAPRALESGEKESGGYVALWLADPVSFRDRSGRVVPKVQELRGKVEDRILKWARYLMYRRYDKSGKLRRRAEEELGW
jgi:hypothetical protein